MNDAAARRYALALMGNVADAERTAVGEVLFTAARVLAHGPAWQILKNPIISVSEKQGVVGELVDPGHPVYRLLAVVIENGREGLIESIAAAYQAEMMEREGRVAAVIRSALPLSPRWRESVEQTLSERVGRRVTARYEVDETLIGGIEVRLPGQVLDGTIRGRLNRLQAQLKREVGTGEA